MFVGMLSRVTTSIFQSANEWSDKMVEKTCDKCQKPSYSSNYQGEWICPYCGKDLTKILANNEDYLYSAETIKK